MGNLITVESARETSRNATRLINIISRNIKEEAEDGKNVYIHSIDSLFPGVADVVVDTFTKQGFSVQKFTEICPQYFVNHNNETETMIDAIITHFVFTW